MLLTKTEERVRVVLSQLPVRAAAEITRLAAGRREGLAGIREICIRAEGRSSLLLDGEKLPLHTSVSAEEMDKTVSRLCDGALYSKRDSIASGYITLSGGIRVGVTGYAKYEYKSFVGVSDIRSLLFRIPGHVCEFAEELHRIFLDGVGSGMLIYSPPGVGKTTALRSLAKSLGSGKSPYRVAVVDERCEFDEEDYRGSEVDILKGYKRKRGIEIATRTMSPEIVMIDELGADDADGVAMVSRCGIPLIATAHAGSYAELLERQALYPLIGSGVFSVFVGIERGEGGYRLRVNRRGEP